MEGEDKCESVCSLIFAKFHPALASEHPLPSLTAYECYLVSANISDQLEWVFTILEANTKGRVVDG